MSTATAEQSMRLWCSSGSLLTVFADTKPLTAIEAAKQFAAFTAVDRHILPEHKVRSQSHQRISAEEGIQVIGIGSGMDLYSIQGQGLVMRSTAGSTVPYVVDRIVQQGVEVNKQRVFIPTGLYP
jgi:ribose 5-phosphate isomerase A